jgi:hypothetical protein
MELDFKYLLLKHKEGARYIFESACDKTFKKEFGNSFAVECNPGDEGIDVFVGNFDEPLIVYQCKFFVESIGDSQKKQIRDSFNTAFKSTEYELKEWNLCIPKALDIDEHKWWATWKKKTTKKTGIEIDLLDSTALLGLLRKHKVDEEVFDLEDRGMIKEIHQHLIEREKTIKEVLSKPPELDYSHSVFISKLNSANITEHHNSYERQFFNAEILEKSILSKGVERDVTELSSLKLNVHDLWLTQYTKHAEEADGNKLLGNINERVEDLNESALKTSLNISVVEKKGLLHQYADSCQVGWVKDYKGKLVVYQKEKDKDGN